VIKVCVFNKAVLFQDSVFLLVCFLDTTQSLPWPIADVTT